MDLDGSPSTAYKPHMSRVRGSARLPRGLVVACVLVAFLALGAVTGAARSATRLRWSPSSAGTFRFGSVTAGKSVSHTFTLRAPAGGRFRGRVSVSLSGSKAFSLHAARPRCPRRNGRLRVSCRVKIVFSPPSQGTSYRARLRATGKHVATSLILSGTSPAAPTNTSAPTLVGTPQDGNTLNAEPGVWAGSAPIGYAYEWERCDSGGASCVEIAGDVSARYLLTSADVGAAIRVRVRATNSAGAAAAVSAATGAVAARLPSSSAPPSIAGTAREGQTLTAAPGSWTGTTPMSFAYQWRRCDGSGSACADIVMANSANYTLTPADAGAAIVLRVTAANAGGSATAESQPTGVVVDPQPVFPIRAAFYYPWFPEAWNQQGLDPFTQYNPSLGFYDSSATDVIEQHIQAMEYGNVQAGIASWWGQGSKTDLRFPALLATTDAMGSSLRWAIYYEPEGTADPTVEQISADLSYIRDRYAADPAYLRIDGRFVVFVYATGLDGCSMADRWKEANTVDAYVVLKVFSGYQTCTSQPDGWHQYGPASAEDSQAGHSFTISPGFYKANEATPRLARDLTRWNQNIKDMVASGAPFQLITTFNEWGEGTSVENAQEWATPSGYGAYLDALHDNGA